MYDKIVKIVTDMNIYGVDVKNISIDSNLITDLGLSSLSIVMIICELENKLNVDFDISNLGTLKTLGDVVNYTEKMIATTEENGLQSKREIL